MVFNEALRKERMTIKLKKSRLDIIHWEVLCFVFLEPDEKISSLLYVMKDSRTGKTEYQVGVIRMRL